MGLKLTINIEQYEHIEGISIDSGVKVIMLLPDLINNRSHCLRTKHARTHACMHARMHIHLYTHFIPSNYIHACRHTHTPISQTVEAYY